MRMDMMVNLPRFKTDSLLKPALIPCVLVEPRGSPVQYLCVLDILDKRPEKYTDAESFLLYHDNHAGLFILCLTLVATSQHTLLYELLGLMVDSLSCWAQHLSGVL